MVEHGKVVALGLFCEGKDALVANVDHAFAAEQDGVEAIRFSQESNHL